MALRPARALRPLESETEAIDSVAALGIPTAAQVAPSLPAAKPIETGAPRPAPRKSLAAPLFGLAVVSVIAVGWSMHGERHIVPAEGLGYGLGLTGSLILLTLLFYPARKSMSKLRHAGKVATWFRLHMVLGIVGPTLIVLHSNFTLKSANATVAMLAMLSVVASGLVGRYLYAHVHRGFHGKKAEVAELLREASVLKDVLNDDLKVPEQLIVGLRNLEQMILLPHVGLRQSIRHMWETSRFAKIGSQTILREATATLAARALREGWESEHLARHVKDVERHADAYFRTLRQAASLALYRRLFSFWHILHLPLYLLLILAACIHVLAVHLY